MQAAGAGAGGAEGPDDRAALGSPGGAAAAAVGAGGAPRIGRGLHVPGPGGDVASRRPEHGLHELALSVPFPSAVEAEIARGSLAPDAEPHGAAVQKELTVTGCALAVHWTAEDSRLLRISTINFLDQLSLVVRTMQRFGPPVSR